MSLGDEYRLLATVPPFSALDQARLKLLAFASNRRACRGPAKC